MNISMYMYMHVCMYEIYLFRVQSITAGSWKRSGLIFSISDTILERFIEKLVPKWNTRENSDSYKA